jgi:hypothetical protein
VSFVGHVLHSKNRVLVVQPQAKNSGEPAGWAAKFAHVVMSREDTSSVLTVLIFPVRKLIKN